MADLSITKSGLIINIDFGDKLFINGEKEISFGCEAFTVRKYDDRIRITGEGLFIDLSLSSETQGIYKVDTVEGVAPSDIDDLYGKLKVLLNCKPKTSDAIINVFSGTDQSDLKTNMDAYIASSTNHLFDIDVYSDGAAPAHYGVIYEF